MSILVVSGNSCVLWRTSVPENELMTDSIKPVISNGWLHPSPSAPTQRIWCGIFTTQRRKDAEPRLETYPYQSSGFGSLALWWSSIVLGLLRTLEDTEAEQWGREIWNFYIRWVCCDLYISEWYSHLESDLSHALACFLNLCHVAEFISSDSVWIK